jgi:hypothetical protein
MEQPDLDFSVPIQQLGSVRSRHASAMGAQASGEVAGRQMVTLLTAYREHGSLTDIEIETVTGVQKSSVIPRRRALQKRGLVVEIGHRVNPASGVSNTTYGLQGAQ